MIDNTTARAKDASQLSQLSESPPLYTATILLACLRFALRCGQNSFCRWICRECSVCLSLQQCFLRRPSCRRTVTHCETRQVFCRRKAHSAAPVPLCRGRCDRFSDVAMPCVRAVTTAARMRLAARVPDILARASWRIGIPRASPNAEHHHKWTIPPGMLSGGPALWPNAHTHTG